MNRVVTIFLVLVLAACTTKPSTDELEWARISGLKCFDFFFNFAIHTHDSTLMFQSIDSLAKYGPTDDRAVIFCALMMASDTDLAYEERFVLDTNPLQIIFDIELRNLLTLYLNEHDSLLIYSKVYHGQPLDMLIREMHDTARIDTACLYPEKKTISIDNHTFTIAKVGIWLHANMFPDNTIERASWKQLIFITRNVLHILDGIRNNRAQSLYSKDYDQLDDSERNTVSLLVPCCVSIYFNKPHFLMPPPPPPSEEVSFDR